jgi:hypothetical protein
MRRPVPLSFVSAGVVCWRFGCRGSLAWRWQHLQPIAGGNMSILTQAPLKDIENSLTLHNSILHTLHTSSVIDNSLHLFLYNTPTSRIP